MIDHFTKARRLQAQQEAIRARLDQGQGAEVLGAAGAGQFPIQMVAGLGDRRRQTQQIDRGFQGLQRAGINGQVTTGHEIFLFE
ncbi:hypothetical protein D3C84_992600 [compost metagenome]